MPMATCDGCGFGGARDGDKLLDQVGLLNRGGQADHRITE